MLSLSALACLVLAGHVSAHPVDDVVRERQTNREIIVRQLEAHKTHPRRATASAYPYSKCLPSPNATGSSLVFANVDSVDFEGVSPETRSWLPLARSVVVTSLTRQVSGHGYGHNIKHDRLCPQLPLLAQWVLQGADDLRGSTPH